jgi:hypothetical protein
MAVRTARALLRVPSFLRAVDLGSRYAWAAMRVHLFLRLAGGQISKAKESHPNVVRALPDQEFLNVKLTTTLKTTVLPTIFPLLSPYDFLMNYLLSSMVRI